MIATKRASSLFAVTALAADFRGSISSGENLSSAFRLRPDTSVYLDGRRKTLVRKDGTFIIQGLKPESQSVLSIISKDYQFPEYLVTVSNDDVITISPYAIGQKLAVVSSNTLPHPLVARPLSVWQYVEPKKPFDVKQMIMGNPMILLMCVGGLFVFVMPKIMANMDPEMLKEAQESQASMRTQMSSMQNMDITSSLSSILAGAPSSAQQEVKKRK